MVSRRLTQTQAKSVRQTGPGGAAFHRVRWRDSEIRYYTASSYSVDNLFVLRIIVLEEVYKTNL